jgi:hypothetical protein
MCNNSKETVHTTNPVPSLPPQDILRRRRGGKEEVQVDD